ncbi:MAG: hypothetical protein M3O32_03750 [Actinomycetota bacterium]|nr:hypothetical protein [Actinomycetota bacterium]
MAALAGSSGLTSVTSLRRVFVGASVVIVGVPAAIANAAFNATGMRVTDLPFRLEDLL